jgi:MT0933-like antitoxin protein
VTSADEAKDKGESLIDDLKEQASGLAEKGKDLLAEHGDKVDSAIDKAADFVDEKTGGKHADKIETAVDKAKEMLDKVAGDAGTDEGPPSKTVP